MRIRGLFVWLMVAMFSFPLFAGKEANWAELGDTASVSGLIGTATVYTKWIPLAKYESMMVTIMANDTGTAGFGGDSLNISAWGYQTAGQCYNSTWTLDTCITSTISVGKFNLTDSAGLARVGSESTTGVVTMTSDYIDTLSVSGWAVQRRKIHPPKDLWIRLYFTCAAHTRVSATKNHMIVQFGKELFQTVHEKKTF